MISVCCAQADFAEAHLLSTILVPTCTGGSKSLNCRDMEQGTGLRTDISKQATPWKSPLPQLLTSWTSAWWLSAGNKFISCAEVQMLSGMLQYQVFSSVAPTNEEEESHMPKCSALQTSAENRGIKSTLGRQSDESSYLSRNRNLRVQLDHKGKRKRPSLAMRHLNLSQKLAENFWGSCDNHFLKTHTQLWNMVKNDAIVTSQLRLRSDIWHEIWSFLKKKKLTKTLWQRYFTVGSVSLRAKSLRNFQGRGPPTVPGRTFSGTAPQLQAAIVFVKLSIA